ncbi:MAG: N-acetyl-gamma-glutamyl-phosphate reductase [Lentisphaerae bacterium]|nr:N-acetyl-gamma-glutamyl-phosphate reductase [Lentisphaerota bacterium]
MQKLRAAIVGASGYSGEELLRLLLRHPGVELTCITSRQEAGKPAGAVFPRYLECTLPFSKPVVDDIAAKADVAFLALPHGLANEFAAPLLERNLKVIDISADFRLHDPQVYVKYYKEQHPAPELLSKAVYGLPEVYREQIRTASLIACPGCYPTSILLPCIPLLKAGLVEITGIEAISLSGVTGAGRKVDAVYIFPECNESMRPYAVTGHRHLPEIEQELALAAGQKELTINFIPHLIPVNRGIHSTILLNAKSGCNADDALECLRQAYAQEPFVRILGKGQLADTKHITMTNFCEIGCAYDARTNRLIISSAIDNLTKGAAGQAVQNLNIIAEFPEDTGLR